MRTLNGQAFYDEPTSCGTCPFFYNGATDAPSAVQCRSERGHCRLWNEMHKTWRSVPPRCKKLFKRLMSYPDGGTYVIVAN